MVYTSNSHDSYLETPTFIPIHHLKTFHLYFRLESISGLVGPIPRPPNTVFENYIDTHFSLTCVFSIESTAYFGRWCR